MTQSTTDPSPTPIEQACNKTDQVQKDLQVAGAELGLAHDALDEHLPPDVKSGDVAWAISQNAAVGQKLDEAVEELAVVNDLLREEVAEREELERKLAESGRE